MDKVAIGVEENTTPHNAVFENMSATIARKSGHLAKVCRKKAASTNNQEQANVVIGETQTEYAMFHISCGSSKPLQTTITVNGNPLTMEVDTGASVSIINRTTFDCIQNGQFTLDLNESNVRLSTYTGEPIEVEGSTIVQVEHNDQSLSLPLIVTKGDGPTLLGREWLLLLRLDWHNIFRVDTTSHTLEDILEKHGKILQDRLGTLQGVSAKLYIDKNVQPHLHNPRPVPFALRQKVEEELERLQTLGVIKPIQFSDWAAPIVPVLKSDGKVRICGDYRVTVNKAARLDKYLIPKIDDLFASLAGGKAFMKLDLSHAYLQIQLERESQDYVTINTHKGLFRYQLPLVLACDALGGRVRKNQDCQKQGHDRRSKAREFNVGDSIYAKNYGPGPAWLPGQVVEVSGAVLYTIMLEDGCSVRRHVEQLRSRTDTGQNEPERSSIVSRDTDQNSESVHNSDSAKDQCSGSKENQQSVPTELTESDLTGPEPAEHDTLTTSGTEAEATGVTEPPSTNQECTETDIRRSTRIRHPPLRYGEDDAGY